MISVDLLKSQSKVDYRGAEFPKDSCNVSIKSVGSSSIRTTTTTRERLADIERQLVDETERRRIAEMAIE